MKIHTIWGSRPDSEIPELLDSWDEYTIEENESGYAEAVKKAGTRTEFSAIRIVILNVPTKAVLAAFAAPVIDAEAET